MLLSWEVSHHQKKVHRNRRQLANSPGTVTETRVNVSFLTERTERGSGGTSIEGQGVPNVTRSMPVCIMARWPTEERDVVRFLHHWQTPSRQANTTAELFIVQQGCYPAE